MKKKEQHIQNVSFSEINTHVLIDETVIKSVLQSDTASFFYAKIETRKIFQSWDFESLMLKSSTFKEASDYNAEILPYFEELNAAIVQTVAVLYPKMIEKEECFTFQRSLSRRDNDTIPQNTWETVVSPLKNAFHKII